ncbi:hypothetical protein I5M27_07235 [Adhaeribacter sp. BT258]|uniref:Uncharacterized protein n=1 Tax=Adhaeribacter terrigena TaxID=2793070 RepID=A0ABS1C046_9BACT|nr:hypothetical protein [Adhaeribacter terrigena]MBK0402774.1 hypothetical protein [Adhaeribacter terrigena]
MENTPEKFAHIKGWGIDADPKNDPTYPMKNRLNLEQTGYSWDRPTLQAETVEVLHSNERPNLTAVFGTALPPSGLSGMIRRWAFNYSENEYRHWLPLIIADRVNVVEGVLDDFMHGKIPNIFSEKGYPAEWKHSRGTLIAKMAGVAIVSTAAILLLSGKGKKKKRKTWLKPIE